MQLIVSFRFLNTCFFLFLSKLTAFPKVISAAFLKKDIFKYNEYTDALEEKRLTLEQVDFNLNQNEKK